MLHLKNYLIRQHIGFAKLTAAYDIINPEDGAIIGVARDEPHAFFKYLRLLVNKALLPTQINCYAADGGLQFSVRRKGPFRRIQAEVLDHEGTLIGYFKSGFFSFRCNFQIFAANDTPVGTLKGNWRGWDYRITNAEGVELGTINKKWAGLGRELFTSADNYVVTLSGSENYAVATLLLAAGLAVDTIFKEGK